MFSFLYKLCFDSQVIKRRMYPTKVYVKLQKLSAQTQLCSIGVCVCCMLVCFNRSFNAICARKSRSRSNTLLVVVFVSFFEKLYKISESDIDVVDAIADQKQVDTHSHSMDVFVKLTHLLEIVDTGEIKKL